MIPNPHNVDLEKTILASMMQSTEEITEYGSDKLEVIDFHIEKHKVVFECIQGMCQSSVGAIDSILVEDAIRDRLGQLESLTLIAELGGVATVPSIVKQCEALKEHSEQRKLLMLSYQIQESIKGADKSPLIKEFIDTELLKMESVTTKKTVHIRDTLPATMDHIHGKSEATQPIMFGYKDLDDLTGGMLPGEFIVIGARPGHAKTAVALDIARNVALQGTGVLFFSLEMTEIQLTTRCVSNIGRVSNTTIRHRQVGPRDIPGLTKAVNEIEGLPIYINSNGSLNVHAIRSEARRMKRKHPEIKIIIVDYLQLIENTKGFKADPRLATNEKSSVLRLLAIELNMPVIALSQLNRQCESRPHPHKRPMLSDLKESGNIEQDAHIILFLYRGWKYGEVIDDIHVEEDELEIIAAKLRDGSPGTAKVKFLGEFSAIEGNSQIEKVDQFERVDKGNEFMDGFQYN